MDDGPGVDDEPGLRWGPFAAVVGVLVVAAVLYYVFALAPGRHLGGACDTDASCPEPLTCGGEAPVSHQCTLDCETTDDCAELGEDAFCIGAGHCVRECGQDAECPSLAGCDQNGGWCRRFRYNRKLD